MPTPPQSDAPPDHVLVERVASGDPRALGMLYDQHASMVFSLAASIVGGDHDAEEVTEDVFMQLWTSADRFDADRGALGSWLATITRSRALDRIRARKRRHAAHERAAARSESGLAAGPANPAPADAEAGRAEVRERVSRALGLLNDDQRRAIELAYFEGLTQSEIARRLGAPLGTVKTRIRDGMTKLRERFAEGEERPR
ncbi:MAG TPA: sigma-70 family RNA polymerase sigma factor [Longimicrobiales bacterium]|nr:sigma-70 family RNA polymerase sigma factor [Longimicrobiales bacterium]